MENDKVSNEVKLDAITRYQDIHTQIESYKDLCKEYYVEPDDTDS